MLSSFLKHSKKKKLNAKNTLILTFIFTYIVTLLVFFISLYGFKLLVSHALLFQPEELPLTYLLACQLTTSSLSFYLGMSWFLPHVWTIINYARYRIPDWQFFPFETLTVSSHCILGSIVSDDKSAVDLVEEPLYITSHFLLPLSRFSLCLSLWQFYYIVYFCGSL